MAQRKIIIAGVGRSGTSFLFEEVAAAMKTIGPARLFYEPYLWSAAKVNELGQVKREPFDTRNLSPFGIYIHCASPLFLDTSHSVHNQMVDHLFGHEESATMTKVIRGNGRLQAFLAADPEVRVLGMTRDVMGTVNSAANHFSFFGEEFHPSDRSRFRSEVTARWGAVTTVDQPNEPSRQAAFNALWWQYMTLALIEAEAAYPDRVLIVDYGSMIADPAAAYDRIDKFLGLPVSQHRLKERVGIVSSSSYLRDVPNAALEPFHEWSREALGRHTRAFVTEASPLLQDFDAVQKGYGAPLPGVVPRYPLYRTVVSWRYALAARDDKVQSLRLVTELGLQAFKDAVTEGSRNRLSTPARVAGKPKVSVIIPIWNAEDTLEAAVASVWAQKAVSAEVVLVDDKSSDGSAALAELLLQRGPGVLVRNQRNLGPALTRHKGMAAAQHDLVSTLDADDLILPWKLESEVDAIGGSPDVVAFSDVLYRRGEVTERWTYEKIENLSRDKLVSLFAAREVTLPRDMTMHRDLYNRTRGYDTLLRMYEDWAFKVELAGVASAWCSTGEVGTVYEHKHHGQSAGDPSKHRFWLTTSYLRNADALALRHGQASIDYLQKSLAQYGVLPIIAEALDRMRSRARFSGNIISDFNSMRRRTHALVARNDVGYDERLRRIYGPMTKLAAV